MLPGSSKRTLQRRSSKSLTRHQPTRHITHGIRQGCLDNGFTADVQTLQVVLEETAAQAANGPCPYSVLNPQQALDTVSVAAPQPAPPDEPRRKIPFPGMGAAAAPPPPAVGSAPPPMGAPQPTAAPAPASAGGFAHQSTSHTYPFDINGFPNLSDGVGDPARAKELMIQFLNYARSIGASDVHVSSSSYPHIRRYAVNYLIDNQPIVTTEVAKAVNFAMISDEQQKSFEERQELDYSADLGNGNRYRVNIMEHFRGIQGIYRIISDKIKSLRELGFDQPEIIEKLTTYHQGLILVTGPSGCGKTTTLAALVELINNARKDHIITVEDPCRNTHPIKRM